MTIISTATTLIQSFCIIYTINQPKLPICALTVLKRSRIKRALWACQGSVGLAVDDDMSFIPCARAISSQDGNWGRNTYGSPTSVTAIISFSRVDMVKSGLQLHGSSFKPFVHITWLYNQWHILVYLVALTGVVQSLLIFMFYAVVSRIYAPLCIKAPLTFLAKVPAQVFLSRV